METIRLERDGDVLTVTIDHPTSDLNAVDEQLHDDLWELFRQLASEESARAIVLSGSGRAFSAGGDLHWFPATANCGPAARAAARGQADRLGPARRRGPRSCAR